MPMSPTEVVAVAFGLLCVWLTTRQSIWCWPTGLVSVTLYVFVFFDAKLYSDVLLQLIYIPLQVYGWWHWKYGREDRKKLPVVRLTPAAAVAWTGVAAAWTGAWGYVMATRTDAALPYWDAWIAMASLVAQYLMTKKVLENWPLWMAVDVVAVGVYWVKDLRLTAGLYAVFFALCVIGLVQWTNSYRTRRPG